MAGDQAEMPGTNGTVFAVFSALVRAVGVVAGLGFGGVGLCAFIMFSPTLWLESPPWQYREYYTLVAASAGAALICLAFAFGFPTRWSRRAALALAWVTGALGTLIGCLLLCGLCSNFGSVTRFVIALGLPALAGACYWAWAIDFLVPSSRLTTNPERLPSQ
jgi:hypothetical protein